MVFIVCPWENPVYPSSETLFNLRMKQKNVSELSAEVKKANLESSTSMLLLQNLR